jgi:prephenate dehydrogenase
VAAVDAGPIAVIGLGCIGGSLARALVAQGLQVRGWSTSSDDRSQAERAGVRVPSDGERGGVEASRGASVVVLAVPPAALCAVAGPVLAALDRHAVALHVCGLQGRQALGLDGATHERLIGTHPLAGSHETGFPASRPDLFMGSTVSIEERANAGVRRRAELLWRAVGASRIEYRTAEEHDRLMTWVSHLPQLVSTALAATLDAAGIDPQSVGPGARDTTRLAASAVDQWVHLLGGAPADLLDALGRMQETIASLRDSLQHADRERLLATWHAGRAWRQKAERRP